jgi:hypothetical protein
VPHGQSPAVNGAQLSIAEQAKRQKQIADERNSRYFKRAVGRNQIRVMPSWRGPGQPWWLEVPTHQNIGPNRRFITCQDFFGLDCGICLAIADLSETESAHNLQLANDMRVTYKCYANVARNEPDGIIKPWPMPVMVFDNLIGYYSDPEYGEHFLHSVRGYDFIFTFNPQEAPSKMYSGMRLAQRPSPICIDGWQKKLPNLDKFWAPTSPHEMEQLLEGKS